jgi:hypothetical protein
MNKLFIGCAVIFFSSITIGYASDDLEDKENRSSNVFNHSFKTSNKPSKHEEISNGDTTLMSQCASALEGFTQRIAQAQQEIWPCRGFSSHSSPYNLVDLKKEFDNLDYSDNIWEALCKKFNVPKWPSQTWQQAYGAYIFYPQKDINIIKAHSSNDYLIFRPDTLFSIMISASCRDPIAQIDMADALHRQGFAKEWFINQLREDGYATLQIVAFDKQSPLMPKVNYLLAKYCYNVGHFKERIQCYQDSESPLSQLELLSIRSEHRDFEHERPALEDYISLGEKFDLGQAYYVATSCTNNKDVKVNLLNQSYEKAYGPASWRLGDYYRTWGNIEQSNSYFLRYAKDGYSHGYLEYTFNIIGEEFGGMQPNPSLKNKNPETINLAIGALKEAIKMRNPEGTYCLGILYQELSKKDESYNLLSQEAFVEAARLGVTLSFGRLSGVNKFSKPFLHPQDFIPQFVSIYGL